jgi:hypothetical protein
LDEARDQPLPGSFPKKDPGYEVAINSGTDYDRKPRYLSALLFNTMANKISVINMIIDYRCHHINSQTSGLHDENKR